jgi:hypothetical protein
MNQVWSFAPQQVEHFSLAPSRMNNVLHHEQASWTRRCSDFVVAARIAYYGVAVALEQIPFCCDGDVLPAGLLISIVNNDDLHRIIENASRRQRAVTAGCRDADDVMGRGCVASRE